jgi:hypothetical protein
MRKVLCRFGRSFLIVLRVLFLSLALRRFRFRMSSLRRRIRIFLVVLSRRVRRLLFLLLCRILCRGLRCRVRRLVKELALELPLELRRILFSPRWCQEFSVYIVNLKIGFF